jgi:hypothetical protein
MSHKDEHDVKAAISALLNAMELINEEWKSNPALVDRIIPLSIDKLNELKLALEKYHQ